MCVVYQARKSELDFLKMFKVSHQTLFCVCVWLVCVSELMDISNTHTLTHTAVYSIECVCVYSARPLVIRGG
jgi:hypothetical protein